MTKENNRKATMLPFEVIAAATQGDIDALCILSPLAYKRSQGLPYAKGGYADREDCKWSATTVIRILQD